MNVRPHVARTRQGAPFNVACAVYAASLPFESLTFGPARGLSSVAGALLVVMAVARAVATRGAVLVPLAAATALSGPAVVALASYWWSISPDATWGRALSYAQLGIVSVAILLLGSRRTVDYLATGFLVGAVCALPGVLTAYAARDMVYNEIRPTAANANANDLAATLAIACALALGTALIAASVRHAYLLFAACFVLAAGVTLTASRSAVVSLAVVAAVALLRRPPQRRGPRQLVVPAIAAIGYYVVTTRVDARVVTRLLSLDEEVASGNFNNRGMFWDAGLARFWERPITGSGSGTMGLILTDEVGKGRVAHNTPIQIAAELGLIGLVAFTAIVIMAISSTRRSGPPGLPMTLVLTALGVNSLTLSWDYDKTLWLSLTAALLLACPQTQHARRCAPHGLALSRHALTQRPGDSTRVLEGQEGTSDTRAR